jgi:hypothetical protein
MKRKNSFFLIGMTSVLLAFAMIGCDNGTSNGGGNTPIPSYPQNPSGPGGMSPTEEFFYKLGINGIAYATIPIELPDGFELKAGQEIVVGTSPVYSVNSLGEGPLFAANGASGTLIIRYPVTLHQGSKVTVLNGGAVNVKTPTNAYPGGGRLIVEGGATLDVQVANGLSIEPQAEAHFEKGAILAVTTTPGSIVVETSYGSYGKLTDEGSKVVIAGIGDSATVALYAENPTAPTIAPIVTIPAGVPAANISDDVKVYATVADTSDETKAVATVTEAVQTQAESASAGNPERTTGDAANVETLFTTGGATTVTYTGNTAITTAITEPTKTLIIKGTISGQSDAISVGTLEIAEGASIALSGAGPITVATALINNGTLDLGANGSIVGYEKVQNNGIIATAITSGATLKDVLKAKGQIVLNASVSVAESTVVSAGTELVIAGGKTLTIANDLTIPSGAGLAVATDATLEVSAGKTLTIAGNIGGSGTITNNGSTIAIAVADEVPLLFILGKVSAGTVEVGKNITIGTAEVASGVTLNIAANTTLNVKGELTVTGAYVTGAANTSEIVVQGGASITGTGAGNFYNSDGTKIASPIPDDTYTWDTTLIGWKASNTHTISGEQETAVAADVVTLLGTPGITKVTYTGEAPITGTITVGGTQKLVITQAFTQATAIGGTGTLEIAATVIDDGFETDAEHSVTTVVNKGIITLNEGGSFTGAVTNSGTIKTADDAALAAILAKVTAGEVQVTGAAELDSAEIKGTATLKVASGELTINTDETLKVTGTLAFETSGTLDNDGTIEAATPTVLAAVLGLGTKLNGKVAVSGTNVDIIPTGTLAIPANTTLTLAENQALTASGGTIDGAGSIDATATDSKLEVAEGVAFGTVFAAVTGNVTQVVLGIDISGPETEDLLELTYVKKDLTTGDSNGFVTIKLGGSVGKTIPAGSIYDIIFSGGANPATVLIPTAATTGYSAVRITGLFVDGTDGTGKITQYNQAFNMWNDGVLQFIGGTYGETGVYKERSDYTGLSSTETFDIPLWNGWNVDSGNAPKIIKLEITQPASTPANKKTYLIDFQNVTFQ